ncbi:MULTISPECIES: chloride channel protein [Klebsiella]|uniref:Chloride transporter, chloride channel (ClC) family protein n=1 Tax=Klebsiella michiganensis (strain ATCC 8724 / DSM 4798 / JCM 20051 / NBRC 3318 / NRRL B-199 / KCTC 1686 / BUCSAV 143 / CCM 1901) TaxID=1006551 RepID=A0A0H3H3D1_KLEM8|nr:MULTISPECIES: chloride channel protein [Klebsiella]AEX02929.1 chloride transporter, chloride channel (ClC) family protein [Klebsiella michiganensis KCTC 1686]AHW86313.1 chloride transporter, chloride channel (ClC) family protein [Klebsiella michiganensis HKOPL1]MBG2549393.1 chloride channel protein [Klebsiella michiganensis]MBZ7187942.1 chloride channel protein [Klebsiella michiganensis]MBZ7228689.1 chloride channel protein [Klebsiella michiganensis]
MTAAAGNKNYLTRLIAVVLTGLLAGLSGMVLALILHAIQHLAFGYSPGQIMSAESFLQGVTDSSWPRRFSAIVAGGAIAGFGWWLLGRYGQKRVSIASAVANPSVAMPAGTTTIHALLQIVTVALGSPLGREVAPREMGALGAGMVARKLGLMADETRTLVACGAGAGLAAVYNVPLAGALFSLEVMLLSFSWEKTLAAIITSAIAAWTATLGLGEESQYHFTSDILPHSFLWWAIIAGPILGAGAWLFRKATSTARSGVRSNWQMPVFCLLAFSLLAVLSLYFPQLPGNGKGPMQLALSDDLGFPGAAMLLALKMVVILAVLRGGAEGGLLTPGLAVGGLTSLLLCMLWQQLLPGGDYGSFALVGAAAFLAASMQMPLTAVALVMEFTHMDHSYLAPTLLCAAGAFLTCRILDKNYAF